MLVVNGGGRRRRSSSRIGIRRDHLQEHDDDLVQWVRTIGAEETGFGSSILRGWRGEESFGSVVILLREHIVTGFVGERIDLTAD